jgi:hypothetical protein
MKLTALLTAAALSAGLWTANAASAQVTGKVTLDGEAPEPKELNMQADPKCQAAHPNPVLSEDLVVGAGNELANVVLSLKSEDKALKGELPKGPVVIDQVGCQYTPHVVGMMVGQEVVVKNSDPLPHNVRCVTIDNKAFNLAQAQKGAENKVGKNIEVPERFGLKCDIHPWMYVHVNAFDHPFFAVTNDKGEFSIPTKGLEDGTYTLEIWHEKLATEPITQEIQLKDGKATVEEIKMPLVEDAAGAAADAVEADVKLAAAEGDGKPCKDGACCEVKGKAAAIVAAAAAAAK